jgi:excinuclease ABC subunit C
VSNVLEKLKLVPHTAGVYCMRDKGNHVIYIGKAKDLYKRLASYFVNKSHDQKTTAMLSRVQDFEYFVCNTENDALCLEANLIKRHKPHYNILLKDNKAFPYILVTDTKIEITRQLNKRGKYFGPYFNGIWASGLLDTIYDIFGIRESADAATIQNIKSFLNGDSDFGAEELLTKKMEQASNLQQYELAIRYRNGIRFLDRLKERTITNVGRDVNCDVFGYASRADIFVVSVLTVRVGKLIGVQNFANKNDSPKIDDEKLDEFIGQYYLENVRPSEVITTAKAGYKKRLVEMSRENAREYIEVSIEKIEHKHQFTVGACQELQKVLGLAIVPKKIECYDISHMGGEGVVASMVTFVDGNAEKKLYRKFRIRHALGATPQDANNDPLSMFEVLTRRLKRLGGTDDSFATAPDLIIVDGGKTQLSATISVAKDIPVIAFGGQYDEVFVPNEKLPIALNKHSYALRLLQRIRDEAHRFAIGYQKEVYRKQSLR